MPELPVSTMPVCQRTISHFGRDYSIQLARPIKLAESAARWPSFLDQAKIGLSEDGSLVVPAASYRGRCLRPRSHPSPKAMATAV